MIRVLLVDDQDLVRGGMRAILDAEDDLEVVGEAGDGARAADVAVEVSPDVVLMDVQMPGVDGIEGLRRVVRARPRARVLMLTMFDLDEYVFAALKEGASGFLLKTTPPAALAQAVRDCHAGEMLFSPAVTRRLVETFVRRPPATDGVPEVLAPLTPRELDVLRAMARTPATVDAFCAELARARGGNAVLDRVAKALANDLRTGPTDAAQHEYGARALVDRMALAVQASLLVRHAPAAVADAFCASRLATNGQHQYGTLSPGADCAAILMRAWPAA